MYSLLLAIIFFAFICLGLSGSLLGAAWPVMHLQLGSPLSYAGIISMIITAGIIAASLSTDRLIRKIGTGLIVVLSVCITSIALFGFSIAGSFLLICLWALPYGLGAGALDVTINNYVAVNYKSSHMNWLHCFWGLGAMIGPYIMGFYLTHDFEWVVGYRTVAMLQVILIAILIASLSLWEKSDKDKSPLVSVKPFLEILAIKGVKYVLPALFAYSAIEATAGLWASTYLVSHRDISAETAASFASLFYTGITVGRFLSGMISSKLGNKKMIKAGISLIFLGIITVLLPIRTDLITLMGLVIIGLGCAPVFPSIIHSTPNSFGYENSQALVGLQMASGYTGSALVPPLFGLIASFLGMSIYPAFLFVFAVLLLVMTTAVNKKTNGDGTILSSV